MQVLTKSGHLHDGGSKVSIHVDGTGICDSVATYGTKPEYIAPDVPARGAPPVRAKPPGPGRPALPRAGQPLQ